MKRKLLSTTYITYYNTITSIIRNEFDKIKNKINNDIEDEEIYYSTDMIAKEAYIVAKLANLMIKEITNKDDMNDIIKYIQLCIAYK